MDYKMDTNGLHKFDLKFYCERCLHGSNNKRDFVRHLSSTKHLKSYKMDALECTKIPAGSSVTNGDPNIPSLLYVSKPENFKKSKKSPEHFQCHCGKKYIYRQGLYKHQKSCEKEKMDKINIEYHKIGITELKNNLRRKEIFTPDSLIHIFFDEYFVGEL